MTTYEIVCLQNAPLSSWSEPHTKDEIVDKFYDYATMEWEEVPPKEDFTLDFIADIWEVRFEEIKQ